MPHYKVFYYQDVTTRDRQSMIINADSPEEAGQKVQQWGVHALTLSEEEENSGKTEKEGEVVSTRYFGLAGEGSITLIPEVVFTESVTVITASKELIADAILGSRPSYSMMEELEQLHCGRCVPGYGDIFWHWSADARQRLIAFDISTLKTLYDRMKS